MFMINKCIYNQPPKDFSREDLKVVVVLVRAKAQRMVTLEKHYASMVLLALRG
jgi:hypothetical protein